MLGRGPRREGPSSLLKNPVWAWGWLPHSPLFESFRQISATSEARWLIGRAGQGSQPFRQACLAGRGAGRAQAARQGIPRKRLRVPPKQGALRQARQEQAGASQPGRGLPERPYPPPKFLSGVFGAF